MIEFCCIKIRLIVINRKGKKIMQLIAIKNSNRCPALTIMVNAFNVVDNNKQNIFSYFLYFYVYMVQDYTI